MFNKACLATMVALLAVLILQSNHSIVLAQGAVEYKSVPVEQMVNSETGQLGGLRQGQTLRFSGTQSVLDEYGSQGWELVTASYWCTPANEVHGTLIFRRKH